MAGGGIVVSEWIEFDNALYFRAAPVNPATAEVGFNAGIFRLDGATGTPLRITDEAPGGDPLGFFGPTIVNGRLTYAAQDPTETVAAGQFAFEVYALEAAAVDPIKITVTTLVGSSYPNAPTVVLGNSSYFVAVDKVTGSHQLYKLTVPADLGATTVVKLTSINEIPDHGMVVDDMIVVGDKIFLKTPVYLAANDPSNLGGDNGGLFVYDTASGITTRLSDDGNPATPQGFYLPGVIGGVLYWGAFSESEGPGSWHLDPVGGQLVFQPNGYLGANSDASAVYADKIYWNGNSLLDGTGIGQVYAFDPVDGSDVPLTSLNSANGGIVVTNFFEMGGALYIHAQERIPGTGFAAGIFKLDAANPLGAVRITDESQPGTPQGLFLYFDTGAGLVYDENDVVTIDVVANDTDHDPSSTADNFQLVSATIASVVGPQGVSLGQVGASNIDVSTGKLQFNPGTAFENLADGQTVTVTFNYTMNDGQGLTSSSTATVVMNGTGVVQPNTLPVANPDTAPGAVEDQTVTIDVVANDTDADGNALTLQSIGTITVVGPEGVTLGTLAANAATIAGNQLVLNPGMAFDNLNEGQTATVTIAYTISDGFGGNASSTATVTFAGVGVSGFAVDGYISGARVFADADGDGVWDEGVEATDITDENGQFEIVGGIGPLVLIGGTDISTGNAFAGLLRAPDGATTITPLTTLVAALLDADPLLSTGDANGQVLSALGLNAGLDLANFDPIAAALSSNPADQAAGADAYAAASRRHRAEASSCEPRR